MSSFLSGDFELTDEDRDEADALAERFRSGPLAQIVRAESMNALKVSATADPANSDVYKALFDEIKQEALDAERSADRTLGIRGRVAAWGRALRDRFARDSLQWLSRLVRRALASLSRLRSR